MTKQKLVISKEGPILEIFNPVLKKSLRYDLIGHSMKKQDESGNWISVCQQYMFFYGYDKSDISSKDEKFLKLIDITSELNPGCKSVSSFISRMGEALIYENYLNEGIEAERRVRVQSEGFIRKTIITKPLEFYTKPVILFFKTFKIMVTTEIEGCFIESYKTYEQLVQNIMDSEIPNTKKKEVFEGLVGGYRDADFFEMINDFKYDMKSLFNYLFNYLEPFEGVTWTEGISTLHDYYEMANKIGRNVKKYPKYLHSMHDIITANYNSFKRTYNEKKFESISKPEMELEGEKYCMVIPKSPKDVISEGTDLNHCVSSYVDKIIEGKTYIMFLRDKKFKDMSLITIELIGDKITQARGSYNRKLEEEEMKFLQDYCKKKKLVLEI